MTNQEWNYLQNHKSYIHNADIQIEKNRVLTELIIAYQELKVSIHNWKQKYLLITPISGTISFNYPWRKNQLIEKGCKIMTVIPEKPGKIIGEIIVNSEKIGKVNKGQNVNIKLNSFPYVEYGILRAKVQNISLVANENKYTVEVELPNGLKTTMNKVIEFSGELYGQAEIIVENRSLSARLISSLRYSLEK